MSITPDTKDWTWVLQQHCAECGFDAAAVAPGELEARTRATVRPWRDVLARDGATHRPAPATWSRLEYACHVRDVYRLFDERIQLMLTRPDPQFPNWDQDVTAVEARYGQQDPATVATELAAAGEAIAATFGAVPDAAWARTGRRSNGSVFTVESLGRYFLHDVVHHLHDVGAAPDRAE